MTNNFEVTTKKLRNGTIRGHLRKQYQFMVSKYPIGTFTIYSCLGEATFRGQAQAVTARTAAPDNRGGRLASFSGR